MIALLRPTSFDRADYSCQDGSVVRKLCTPQKRTGIHRLQMNLYSVLSTPDPYLLPPPPLKSCRLCGCLLLLLLLLPAACCLFTVSHRHGAWRKQYCVCVFVCLVSVSVRIYNDGSYRKLQTALDAYPFKPLAL